MLATRNGAAFLDEQLLSLAAQTHPSIDIWASDDGSTDGTLGDPLGLARPVEQGQLQHFAMVRGAVLPRTFGL